MDLITCMESAYFDENLMCITNRCLKFICNSTTPQSIDHFAPVAPVNRVKRNVYHFPF